MVKWLPFSGEKYDVRRRGRSRRAGFSMETGCFSTRRPLSSREKPHLARGSPARASVRRAVSEGSHALSRGRRAVSRVKSSPISGSPASSRGRASRTDGEEASTSEGAAGTRGCRPPTRGSDAGTRESASFCRGLGAPSRGHEAVPRLGEGRPKQGEASSCDRDASTSRHEALFSR
jgi:hypothetical protein